MKEKEQHREPKTTCCSRHGTFTPNSTRGTTPRNPRYYRNHVGPSELSQLDTLEIKLRNRCSKHEQDRPTGHGARTHQHGAQQAPFAATTRWPGCSHLRWRWKDWHRDCRAIARRRCDCCYCRHRPASARRRDSSAQSRSANRCSYRVASPHYRRRCDN